MEPGYLVIRVDKDSLQLMDESQIRMLALIATNACLDEAIAMHLFLQLVKHHIEALKVGTEYHGE